MTTFPRIAAHVSTANLMTQKNSVGPDDDDEEDDVPENIAGPDDGDDNGDDNGDGDD